MKKINKIFQIILISISTLTFLFCLTIGTFFYVNISSIKYRDIENIKYPKSTKIYDSSDNLIEDIAKTKMDYVKYEDIPKLLIDALLSIEDQEFYFHHGINEKRILSSLINNLSSFKKIQGASTITQQIVKNTMLTSDKTYERKIKEIYLSFLLEKEMSKEEILELYFNHVYFEKSYPGIIYASRRFFNKELDELSLCEIATLVGLVKSPSLYCPINHPENANERKNVVLNEMYKNKVITLNQYNICKDIDVSSLIHIEEPKISYKYQAYLDIVYQEINQILGLDIYEVPLKVETYLDSALQSHLDDIQEGKIFSFDDVTQIGSSIIKNSDCSIQGVIGGINYKGKKLYNRASNLLASPASTIKPIFTYALGVEKFNLNQLSTFLDEETMYPNTLINVHNADKSYLGYLSLIECLGYSRNTTTISLCSKLQEKFSSQFLIDYLNSINIFDDGIFSLSYALGGFTYGTNPISLSGAYAMIANEGKYLLPSTIKRITSLDTGEILYERGLTPKQILSSKTSNIITDSLIRVVNSNFYNIKEAKPDNIEIAGKTGTNAYDKETINKYNLPSNADKDIWFCGYSNEYTIATWAGFDKFDKKNKTYFYSSDTRKKLPKYIFKNVMEFISNKNLKFTLNDDLEKVYIVKHLDNMYFPNEYIPSSFIDYVYVDKNTLIRELPPLEFALINDCKTIVLNNQIILSINTPLTLDSIYTRIYGDRIYLIKIYFQDEIKEIISSNSLIEINLNEKIPYKIEIMESFLNNHSLFGIPYIINI